MNGGDDDRTEASKSQKHQRIIGNNKSLARGMTGFALLMLRFFPFFFPLLTPLNVDFFTTRIWFLYFCLPFGFTCAECVFFLISLLHFFSVCLSITTHIHLSPSSSLYSRFPTFWIHFSFFVYVHQTHHSGWEEEKMDSGEPEQLQVSNLEGARMRFFGMRWRWWWWGEKLKMSKMSCTL